MKITKKQKAWWMGLGIAAAIIAGIGVWFPVFTRNQLARIITQIGLLERGWFLVMWISFIVMILAFLVLGFCPEVKEEKETKEKDE